MWSAYYPANRALDRFSQRVSAFIPAPKGGTGRGERREDGELIEFTAAVENIGLILAAGQDSFPQEAAGWGGECWFNRLRRSFFMRVPWE